METPRTKTLVLFVFHIYNSRVESFINNCIFYDESVDFVIIANDKEEEYNPEFRGFVESVRRCQSGLSNSLNVDYINRSNVHLVFRDNIGYDFGGWSDALLTDDFKNLQSPKREHYVENPPFSPKVPSAGETKSRTKMYQNYDKFIFVNSSVIGPFLADGYLGNSKICEGEAVNSYELRSPEFQGVAESGGRSKSAIFGRDAVSYENPRTPSATRPEYFTVNWTDVYLTRLNDNVKLFGSTINTCCDPLHKSHVQSYIFAMEKPALEYLIDQGIFSMKKYTQTLDETVRTKEVLMSRKIIENGWNIGCLLPYYDNVDFTFKTKRPEDYHIRYLFNDDVLKPQYRNVFWNEYQLVFIKGNRGILDGL